MRMASVSPRPSSLNHKMKDGAVRYRTSYFQSTIMKTK